MMLRRFENLGTKTKVLAGTLVPLALPVIVSGLVILNIQKMTESARWVDHTHTVLSEAAAIVASAVDMETGARGFLLAGDPAFLAPYEAGEREAYRRIEALQETVSDNPRQVARLAQAESVLKDWQTRSAEVEIALRREIGDAPTMNDLAQAVRDGRGKVYFDRLREQLETFSTREQVLLAERREAFETRLASGQTGAAATQEALRWVSHTYAVLQGAARLLAAAVDMETGVRGYLLAGRPEFLEPYETGGAAFDALSTELAETVSDNPPQVALIGEMQATVRAWKTEVVAPLIELRARIGDARTMDDMADLVAEARGKTYFDAFREVMGEFSAEEARLMATRQTANAERVSQTYLILIGATGLAVLVGLLIAWGIGTVISRPIVAITGAMRRLAQGDTAAEIDGRERLDEVGEMARATQVFKENAIRIAALTREKEEADRRSAQAREEMMAKLQQDFGAVVERAVAGDFSRRIPANFPDAELDNLAHGLNRLLETVDEGLGETVRVMARIADGDLGDRMKGSFDGSFTDLQRSVNVTVERLSELVGRIAEAVATVRANADDMTLGAQDLSARAEQQAAAIEKTSATMEQISSTIRSNAESSTDARNLAAAASADAEGGGKVVQGAVEAMTEIEASARRISEIIAVIDSIAFQTNLLALNAAVEAARAGDAGKGFAVVAAEVRSLAQRSSEASRDIRELIETSAGQVSEGVRLVTRTGESLSGIVSSISRVEAAVREIEAASREQSSGVEEITLAISSMDQMTQQNSTLAERTATGSRDLLGGARELDNLLSFFSRVGSAETRRPDAKKTAA